MNRAADQDQDEDEADEVETPGLAAPKPDCRQICQGTRDTVLYNICGNYLRRGTGTSTVVSISVNDIRQAGRTILKICGNEIRDPGGSTVMFKICGNEIRDSGGTVLMKIIGNTIRAGSTIRFTIIGGPLSVRQLAALLGALQCANGSGSGPVVASAKEWTVTGGGVDRLRISKDNKVFHSGSQVLRISGDHIYSSRGGPELCTVKSSIVTQRGKGVLTIRSGSFQQNGKTIASVSGSKITGGGKHLDVAGGPLTTVQIVAVLIVAGIFKP